MLLEGLKLLVIGMGFVFVFLLLLFLAVSLAGKVLAPIDIRHAAEREDSGERELTAVIAAAVALFRANREGA